MLTWNFGKQLTDHQQRGCRLIVHADDFGLNENVNNGIELAHNKGILTSTSIMAVGKEFKKALQIYRTIPSLDVGIHLTLTEEKPLTSADSIPTLVNRKGKFHRHAKDFTRKYLLGKIDLREVRQEIDAQIRIVLDNYIPISHIDSHQHIHMLPRIFLVVLELAAKYKIKAVRIPYEKLHWSVLLTMPSIMRMAQLMILNSLCIMAKKKYDLPYRTDYFAGFVFSGNLNTENLRLIIQNLPKVGCCEIMCHPGRNEFDDGYSHWNYNWASELNALMDSDIISLLTQRKVELISYRDIDIHFRNII